MIEDSVTPTIVIIGVIATALALMILMLCCVNFYQALLRSTREAEEPAFDSAQFSADWHLKAFPSYRPSATRTRSPSYCPHIEQGELQPQAADALS